MTTKPYKNILLADRVYERLEDDIIFGRYAPGQVLTELGLAEELGVSRTPVREAMRRLTQERLIADGDSGKGSVVLGITKEDVRDIMNIRLRLEGLASYYAALNITPRAWRNSSTSWNCRISTQRSRTPATSRRWTTSSMWRSAARAGARCWRIR